MPNKIGQMQQQMSEIEFLNLETTVRREINELFEEHHADPNAMQKAFEVHYRALQKIIPKALMQEAQEYYTALIQGKIDQATLNHKKNMILEQRDAISENYDQALQDLTIMARQLFDPDQSDKEAVEIRTRIFDDIKHGIQNMQENLAKNSVDGNPVLTKEEQIIKVKQAQEVVFTEASLSWWSTQTDKMASYKDWIKDKVIVFVRTEGGKKIGINLRQSLSPSTRAKMDSDIEELLRADFNIITEGEENA